MEMSRVRRSSALVALIVAAASGCAAHEPRPRLHVPDEPAPPLAEWRGPIVAEVAPAAEPPPPPAEPEADAREPAPPTEPVKLAESPAQEAYERGKLGAREDLAAGRLRVEVFGAPAWCRWEYARILRAEYDVDMHEVLGCAVTDEIFEHTRGYNEVMAAEIQRRHGKDVFAEALRKAGCR